MFLKVYEDFGKTEFAKWMKDEGIEVPTTDEQLAALAKENRPVYREFLETFGVSCRETANVPRIPEE